MSSSTSKAIFALPVSVILFGAFFGTRALIFSTDTVDSAELAKNESVSEFLNEDGEIDYLSHSNKLLSEGVTANNNAAIPILEIYYATIKESAVAKEFTSMLGVEALKTDGPAYVEYSEFKNKHGQAFKSQFDEARVMPWTKDQNPLISDWIKANEDAYKKFEMASALPEFYVPARNNKIAQVNSFISFQVIDMCRRFGNLVMCRAMRSVGERDFVNAQKEFFVLHRLARLFGKSLKRIEQDTAMALDIRALDGEAHMYRLWQDENPDALRYYRNELAKLKPVCDLKRMLDEGERVVYLETTSKIATAEEMLEKNQMISNLGLSSEAMGMLSRSSQVLDWNQAMNVVGDAYDEMSEALGLENYQERAEEIYQLRTRYSRNADKYRGMNSHKLIFGSSKSRGKALGIFMVESIFARNANFNKWLNKDGIQRMKTTASIASAAIVEYRIKNKKLPEKLSDLVPDYLEELPMDLFAGKPTELVYLFSENNKGFSLTAVGDSPVRKEDDIRFSVGFAAPTVKKPETVKPKADKSKDKRSKGDSKDKDSKDKDSKKNESNETKKSDSGPTTKGEEKSSSKETSEKSDSKKSDEKSGDSKAKPKSPDSDKK